MQRNHHVLASYAGPAGMLTVDATLSQRGVRLSVFDVHGRRHVGHLSAFQARRLGEALASLSRQAYAAEEVAP